MEALVLGAGQDVGRSCVVVSVGQFRVMFDCGMHMGYADSRRFPDFSQISPVGRLTEAIDCVVVTHFHLDHCGALPYLTEVCGYSGPVFMSAPTRAICPILLEDYRHIMVDRKGTEGFYTADDIAACMRRVTTIALHETIDLDGLRITPYCVPHAQ